MGSFSRISANLAQTVPQISRERNHRVDIVGRDLVSIANAPSPAPFGAGKYHPAFHAATEIIFLTNAPADRLNGFDGWLIIRP